MPGLSREEMLKVQSVERESAIQVVAYHHSHVDRGITLSPDGQDLSGFMRTGARCVGMSFRFLENCSRILLKSRVNKTGETWPLTAEMVVCPKTAKTSLIDVSLARLIGKWYDFAVYRVIQGFFRAESASR